MKKTVKITALEDRPMLCIKKGDVLQMELEDDMLIALHNEQIKGLVAIEELKKDLE